jgi:hypothetical protein
VQSDAVHASDGKVKKHKAKGKQSGKHKGKSKD